MACHLRAYLDAALASLKACAPAADDSASGPRGPYRRPARARRVERPPPSRLAELELVRTLAPALFGEVLLCADRRARGYGGARTPLVAVKRVELASARARRTLERGVRVAEDLERERAVHYALAAAVTAGVDGGCDGDRDPLGSRNLLLLREEVQCRGSLFLVFDYCARGDLFDRVRSSGRGRLSERTARVYLRDVVRALGAMKARGFAHRDISLENVMLVPQTTAGPRRRQCAERTPGVEGYECSPADEGYECTHADEEYECTHADEDDCCYLGDFGLAIRADRPAPAGRVGKTWYMAPEVFAADRAVDALAADIWSLGVLLCIMLTGAPLVRAAAPTDAHFRAIASAGGLAALLRKWFPTDAELSADARALLAATLDVDPARRPTLEQVAAHPFLAADGDGERDHQAALVGMAAPRRSSLGGAVARSVSKALSRTRFSWASTSSSASSEDLDARLSSECR